MSHNLFRITLLSTAMAMVLAACAAPATEQQFIATLAPATEAVPTVTEIPPTNTPEPTATQVVLSSVTGRIVFRSTRSGSDDIWVMNGVGSGLTNLTNGGHNESPAWSPDGSRIAWCKFVGQNLETFVMNADGSDQTNLSNNPADDCGPGSSWSPDGTKIAFTSFREGNGEIYVMNADGSGQTRLTDNPASDEGAAWSPDAKKIAFTSDRDGQSDIYLMNADGSGATRLTNLGIAPGTISHWSPDGTKIAFGSSDGNIFVINADGTTQTNLTKGGGSVGGPIWSPDGTQIIFASNRDGNIELYVMNADGSGLMRLTDDPAEDYSADWTQ